VTSSAKLPWVDVGLDGREGIHLAARIAAAAMAITKLRGAEASRFLMRLDKIISFITPHTPGLKCFLNVRPKAGVANMKQFSGVLVYATHSNPSPTLSLQGGGGILCRNLSCEFPVMYASAPCL